MVVEATEDQDDLDPQARDELSGLLVQAMALSRASSMPASSLFREVVRENPHMSDRRSKEAWLAMIRSVLQCHAYFGRIEREGLVRLFFYYRPDSRAM